MIKPLILLASLSAPTDAEISQACNDAADDGKKMQRMILGGYSEQDVEVTIEQALRQGNISDWYAHKLRRILSLLAKSQPLLDQEAGALVQKTCEKDLRDLREKGHA